jgi:2-keto-4-pentenoate hydratase/2-oxohepta-3-ene-1,7-dioic acid hydratase in catechol pathway
VSDDRQQEKVCSLWTGFSPFLCIDYTDEGKELFRMLLVNYRVRGSNTLWRAGIAHEQAVVDAGGYAPLAGEAVGEEGASSVRRLLQRGNAYLEEVFAWAGQQFEKREKVLALDSLELGPPVPDPDKIICLGVNYRAHAEEAGMKPPPVPVFFAKFPNSLTGPTSPIVLPGVSTHIDYEAELAVIIARAARA